MNAYNKAVHGTSYAPQTCASLRSVYHIFVPLRWSRDCGVRWQEEYVQISKIELRKRCPVYMDAIPFFHGSDKSLYIALYNKGDFEDFSDFGDFCYSICTIQQDWYTRKDLDSALEWYSPNEVLNPREAFMDWITKARKSDKDLFKWISFKFKGLKIDWLKEGMINEIYYSDTLSDLEGKGVGHDYYLDIFVSSTV